MMEKAELNLDKLKIKGRVLTAQSEGYDEARATWDLSVSQRPRVIVEPLDVEDIVAAVNFAKENNLNISVKNTGHGVALPADEHLLIVVSSMTGVSIDAEQQTAKVEAGAQWADVLEKVADLGLAPLMGSSSDVGAIGYTLGGGMGWLSRKYGLAVDSVVSFDIVTADGQQLHVSPDENKELFWGISGAGAAFGVIAAMEIKLFPVETVYGGSLTYQGEEAAEMFTRYKQWIHSISDDWTTSISLVNYPPLPFLPEELHGKKRVVLRGCYAGEGEEGAETIQSWVKWKEPLSNTFDTFPFSEADRISEDPTEPSPTTTNNIILTELTDEVIDFLIRRDLKADESKNQPAPLFIAELHQAGGAIAQAAGKSEAFSQHDAAFILKLVGNTHSPEATKAFNTYLNEMKKDLEPHSDNSVYLNYVTGMQKFKNTQNVFTPDTYERLIKLKKQYDPENIFSFSLNIPPAR